MNKKSKTLVVTLAAALAVIVSVFGTMAFLTATDDVENTFVAGGIIAEDFKLWEHKAVKKAASTNYMGEYGLTNEKVQENEYIVFPNVPLPKDPFIEVKVNENAQAYLFIEVIDNLPKNGDPDKGIAWDVDDANWEPLMMDGGEQVKKGDNPIWVYYHKEKGVRVRPFTGKLGQDETNIIKDGKITVPEYFEVSTFEGRKLNLKFNGYLCQAMGFPSALAAWDACFGANAGA